MLSAKREEVALEDWLKENISSFVYLKLVEQIFAIIHERIPASQSFEPIPKILDSLIPTHLHAIIQEFETLNDRNKA